MRGTAANAVDSIRKHAFKVAANRRFRLASPSTQLQLLNNSVISRVQHLFALVAFSESNLKLINKTILKALRRTTYLFGRTPSAFVQSITRAILSHGWVLQHRLRLLWTLQLQSHPAQIAYTILSTASLGKRSKSLALRPWLLVTQAAEHDANKLGVDTSPPTNTWDIHRASVVAGRAFAHALWRHDMLKKCGWATSAQPSVYTSLRSTPQRTTSLEASTPPSWTHPPAANAMSRVMHYAWLANVPTRRLTALGTHSFTTPLGVTGPGGNGSILPLQAVGGKWSRILICLQQGGITANRLLFSKPNGHDDFTKLRPCTGCHEHRSATLWHVLFECSAFSTHPGITAIHAKLAHLFLRLLALLQRMSAKPGPMGWEAPPDPDLPDAAAIARVKNRQTRPQLDIADPYCRSTIYRMLLAAPWCETDLPTPPQQTPTTHVTWHHAAAVMGALMRHAIKHRHQYRQPAALWEHEALRLARCLSSITHNHNATHDASYDPMSDNDSHSSTPSTSSPRSDSSFDW